MVPYKRINKRSRVRKEFAPLELEDEYLLKFKLMDFVVSHRDGAWHERKDCLSMQLFSQKNGKSHFLKAISIKLKDLSRLISSLEKIAGDTQDR